MRGLDKIAVILLIVLAVVGHWFRDGGSTPDDERSPRRPAPHAFEGSSPSGLDVFADVPARSEAAPASRAPLVREGVIEVETRARNSTGTAFAVADGIWLTARHVIEGCSKAGIQYAPKKAQKIERFIHHPNADVSLVFTKGSADALNLAASDDTPDGFHIGFPQGSPGAMHGERLGRTKLRYTGAYRVREVVTAWSEVSRLPAGSSSLGGMSGGPVFDNAGRVIGIVLAESRRRGRTYTATPQTIADMMDQATPSPLGEALPAGALGSQTYGALARDLITSKQISRVLCIGPS